MYILLFIELIIKTRWGRPAIINTSPNEPRVCGRCERKSLRKWKRNWYMYELSMTIKEVQVAGIEVTCSKLPSFAASTSHLLPNQSSPTNSQILLPLLGGVAPAHQTSCLTPTGTSIGNLYQQKNGSNGLFTTIGTWSSNSLRIVAKTDLIDL